MNAIQILILLACVAVLVVNYLTWRSTRKTCTLLAAARESIETAGIFTVGEIASLPRVREAIAASQRRRPGETGPEMFVPGGRPIPLAPAGKQGFEPFEYTERS
ncbi:hypothetical protein [Variovorax saccharolyticus]|uniref:hypothetical protein n=1 Tax=Variovorax saccharolyticus TaxID=3053516 RepID=UPI002575060A|nr:hypothetical protein [Variovorax sp. J31P216]MDM0024094.1 hypothetical protein [Variovorax sp. J31P216]